MVCVMSADQHDTRCKGRVGWQRASRAQAQSVYGSKEGASAIASRNMFWVIAAREHLYGLLSESHSYVACGCWARGPLLFGRIEALASCVIFPQVLSVCDDAL